jgi:hypothetical protein
MPSAYSYSCPPMRLFRRWCGGPTKTSERVAGLMLCMPSGAYGCVPAATEGREASVRAQLAGVRQ